jgi:hypothetical protein
VFSEGRRLGALSLQEGVDDRKLPRYCLHMGRLFEAP